MQVIASPLTGVSTSPLSPTERTNSAATQPRRAETVNSTDLNSGSRVESPTRSIDVRLDDILSEEEARQQEEPQNLTQEQQTFLTVGQQDGESRLGQLVDIRV